MDKNISTTIFLNHFSQKDLRLMTKTTPPHSPTVSTIGAALGAVNI